jgi:hypothetical protein
LVSEAQDPQKRQRAVGGEISDSTCNNIDLVVIELMIDRMY